MSSNQPPPGEGNSFWPAWATESVQLVAHDPQWASQAASLIQEIQRHVPGLRHVLHIGSTAIPGMPAKPIIDLMAIIPSFDDYEVANIAAGLSAYGWHFVPPDLDQRPERRFFVKAAKDHRIAHLHLMEPGSVKWGAQLRFRDILRTNEELAGQYAALKQAAANTHTHDREAYTEAKSKFIKDVLNTSKPTLIFATNNAHKVEEIQAAIGNDLHVVSLKQAGIDIDIPEPHSTLEGNASEKSSTIHLLTGGDCFSEDTGLEVDALNGEPGVKSARYADEERQFSNNIEKLLHKLEGHTSRTARFRTVISLILAGKEYLFEGICEGQILAKPTGEKGFGYDPVFRPDGADCSFAEMTMEEKNFYSHRRKAADKLVAFLREQPSH